MFALRFTEFGSDVGKRRYTGCVSRLNEREEK